MFKYLLPSAVIVLGLGFFAAPLMAQTSDTPVTTTPALASTGEASTTNTPVARAPLVFSKSFLFTPAELSMLLRAGTGKTSGAAILNSGSTRDIPKVRQIKLSGVVYRGSGDWTIWLNGSKLEPGRLLPEIMDIHVQEDRVFLRWFDIGLNDVISITLRPHQTYDIVTGILLPG